MAKPRNLQRDFLALLGPGEPQHGCDYLDQCRADRESDQSTAATIRKLLIDPLEWFMQATFEKRGRTEGFSLAENLFLSADDIQRRFVTGRPIYPEHVSLLRERWVEFQASVGHDDREMLAPLAAAGRGFKEAQRRKAALPRARIKVDGESFSMSKIIAGLAAQKDEIGDPLPTSHLWPLLFSELDRRALEPKEEPDKIVFNKNDDGDRDDIKRSSFNTMVSQHRKKRR